MELELGFGTGVQRISIEDRYVAGVLTPNSVEVGLRGEAEVRRALCSPIGSPRLRDMVKPGETVAIVTSDVTRPMPTYKVMPALLDELNLAGVRREDITLVFALGSHRAQSDEERRKLAGERAFSEIRCIDSDASRFTRLGVTRRGTPVDIFTPVAKAARRICLGNIEYHYFAGYSGGAKAIMPGVSTRMAIQANHSRMVEETSRAGLLEGNNLREDIEEAAALCGVDFIVNVVLDEKKEIIRAVAGDVTRAHREGCRFLDKLYLKEIDRPADIVVVSQGGAPKDLNLYQTQKALDNARHAVRRGGTIILIGSCREGYGERVFEEWLRAAPDARSMIDRIRTDFRLGGHKAAAIAQVLERAEVVLVSEMPDEDVRRAFLKPAKSAQSALEEALKKYGEDAKVLIMPYGGSTLPKVKSALNNIFSGEDYGLR